MVFIFAAMFATLGSAPRVNGVAHQVAHTSTPSHGHHTLLGVISRSPREALPAVVQRDAETVGRCIKRGPAHSFSGMFASGHFMSAASKTSPNDVVVLCNKESAPREVILRMYPGGDVRNVFETTTSTDTNAATNDIEAVSAKRLHRLFPGADVVSGKDYIVFKERGKVVAGADCYKVDGTSGCMGIQDG